MVDQSYFSDRERGPRARTQEVISERVWGALCDLIQGRVEDGSFGYAYPDMCPDGAGPSGTDARAFWRIAAAEIPELPDSIRPHEMPDTIVVLDLLEFCARSVGKPIQGGYHSYFNHYHLDFDRDAGLAEFVASVNRLFARNGIALELTTAGLAQRLGPPGLREALRDAVFHTGDDDTDRLLEDARRRILSAHPVDRRDAIEKLWDAFERIKTLEPGAEKKAQATRLLDRAAPSAAPRFRQFLETESQELTRIGNTLRIRHSETDKEPLQSLGQIDYLFHRMFSFLLFLLRATSRAS